jgi:hypothetical protein
MLGFSIPRDSFPGKFGIELAPYVFVIAKVFSVVPLAGIEPALLAELDFESSASTSSATGAFAEPVVPARPGQGARSGRTIAGGGARSTRADVIVAHLDSDDCGRYEPPRVGRKEVKARGVRPQQAAGGERDVGYDRSAASEGDAR